MATISANGDRNIGDMLADLYEKVGIHGTITVQEGKTLHHEVEYVDGLKFDRGYISPYFVTDTEKMEAVLENPYILIHDKKISTMKDLVAAFENHSGKYHIILDERGHQIVLDRSKVDQNSQRILERYRVTADRSKNLKSSPSEMSQQQGFDPVNTVVQMGREN